MNVCERVWPDDPDVPLRTTTITELEDKMWAALCVTIWPVFAAALAFTFVKRGVGWLLVNGYHLGAGR